MTRPTLRPPGALDAPVYRFCVLLLALALLASGLTVVKSRTGVPGPVGDAALAVDIDVVATEPLEPEAAAATEPEPVPEVVQPPVAEVPAAPAPAAEPEPPPPPALPPGEVERIPLIPLEPRLAAFAGLSTWVDLFDIEISPEEQAAQAAAGGVQTIFAQTARFNSAADIHDPDRLARLIDAAKDRGLKVMTWYIPDFLDPERDLRRSQAAISFTTPRGNRADAFGLDIEVEDLPDIALRNARLLQLSADLRSWAGPQYPMAAIVLPPLQLDLRPGWWPAFPWAELRPYYDVYVPMSYSTFRGTDAGTTYNWNFGNIVETRRRTGDFNLPIHMAGGIADRLPHVDAFVAALRDGLVSGGGLYDLDTTPASAWHPLRALRLE